MKTCSCRASPWRIFAVLFAIIFGVLFLNTIARAPSSAIDQLFESEIARTHPIRRFRDRNGERRDVIAVCAPFRNHESRDFIFKLKSSGVKIVGVQHYQEFPGAISNPHEDPYYTTHFVDYLALCEAWLTCQKQPESVFGKPHIDIIESDFANVEFLNSFTKGITTKEFDFIYSIPNEPGAKNSPKSACSLGWQAHCRNWELAKKCLPILCNKMGLFGVIVGRECIQTFDELGVSNHVQLVEFQKYHDLQKLFKRARFIFVPNKSDASPRVLTECLCHGTPCVVNKDIFGGWKYTEENEKCGAQFTNPEDLEKAVRHVLTLQPADVTDEFQSKFGYEKSGERLAKFFKTSIGIDAPFISFA